VPPDEASTGRLLDVRSERWSFYAPPVVVAAIVGLGPLVGRPVSLTLVALAAIPGLAHILSTGTVYLDAQNRRLFRDSGHVFYVAPILIVALAGALTWSSPGWLTPILLLTAVHHNTRQSTGILNLTRRARGTGALRGTEEALVWAGNAACLAWSPWLDWAAPFLPVRLLAGTALVAITAVYLGKARHAPPRGLHGAFLLIAATLSWPLVAVGDPLVGWALMALPHQAQYLGVFWTCQRQRYRNPERRRQAAPLLRLLTEDAVFCALFLAALASALAYLQAGAGGTAQQVAIGAVLACTLVHYWLDAFLWRARDPKLRSLLIDHLPALRPVAAT